MTLRVFAYTDLSRFVADPSEKRPSKSGIRSPDNTGSLKSESFETLTVLFQPHLRTLCDCTVLVRSDVTSYRKGKVSFYLKSVY